MGMVRSYEVAGPGAGDATATWSLTGDDRGDFDIGSSDGVLTFKNTPDFETPADNGGDNAYEVTVNARVGGGNPHVMTTVMVMVTNEDEDGVVTVLPSQPAVGSPVRATLVDEDGGWSPAKLGSGPALTLWDRPICATSQGPRMRPIRQWPRTPENSCRLA